ncbi:class I SAM-dependent methyltransferase [Hydrogenophaga sp. NFH-34]|uniref:class I SAM-dependent methyltransferase n=1 Tax=Hydrogenophaga sp. NFH-34 TaxID=2744446 RepID=UPI001F1E655A|nr:class I SAM-dependent methyltransferase [Hydrogenophaga sp. NFH-34]
MQALLDAIARATPGPDAQRLFHGRGGLFPGCEDWALDWFAPVWLLTKFGEATDEETQRIAEALAARQAQLAPELPLNWVFQRRQPDGPVSRPVTTLMAGTVPEPHTVTEDGARYRVQVQRGQNHGLFLDMAEGRRWVRAHAQNAKVLNLFAYTCAFSVAALQGGAREVINIDMAQGALATGQQNHPLNGFTSGAKFLAHDLFSSWGKVTRMGPYDLVVADPPSYQKGSFVANKDWPRLLRRLPDLLKPGGRALLCLNAPEIPEAFLHEHLAAQAPELLIEQRLPNPPAFADASPDRALKVLVVRLPPLAPAQ